MRKALLVSIGFIAVLLAALAVSAPDAQGYGSLYDSECQTCHGSTRTCAGCHAHGVHSNNSKSDLNLTADTDKTTYSPGEAMTVTVDGGYRGNWVRVILYDETGTEITRSTGPSGIGGGAALPVVLDATAPLTPGTYTYTASWYGNQYDIVGAYFGPNWTPSANPGHGEEKVSTNSFDVVGAAAPDIAVSPPSINFGSITTGQSSTAQPVTITNNGSAALSVTTIALSGTGSAHFILDTGGGTTPCGSTTPTISAGGNCTVTVTFSPTTTGAKSASLDISSDDPDTPTASVTLSGTGAAPVPDIAVSALSLSFGDVETGSSSSPQTVTISNTGTGDLSVTGMVISGTNAAEFSLNTGGGSNPCGSTSPSIPAGNNCTVTVTMSPTTTGAKSASLGISSDDPDENPVNISLSGNGTPPPVPDITVSPLTVGFGTIQEGTTSDQTVTVTNDGNATLNVGNIAVANPLASPFSISANNCSSASLAATASCTITVTFAPATAGGPYSDSFDIPSNDPDENPVTVVVSGTATSAPVADISLSPLSVNFGGVKVGSSSSPRTVTISNVGTADLSVTAMAVSGTHAADFSLDPGDGTGGTCGSTPVTVTAAGNCTVTVTFSPSASGTRSASLGITSDDPDEPSVSVALAGTGAVPDINVTDSVAPAGDLAVDFGDVTVATPSAAQTITVANNGTADLNVTNMTVTGANAADFSLNVTGGGSPCGSTSPVVPQSSSCTVTITFTPAALGARNASLGITSDDPDESPVNVSLQGNGTPTPVPDIAVTDSVGTVDDLQVPYGDVTVGTSSPAATVTIANQGTAALSVTGIALSGTNAAEFTLNTGGGTSPCGTATPTILAGTNCTVTVTFNPATTGAKSASLDITSDDPDENPVNISLTGNGTPTPVPDIAVTDSVAPAGDLAVDFGSVQAGSSAYQTVTVTNNGNADLSFTGIAQANTLAEPFGISGDSCSGVPLSPAANCTVLVRFTPSAAGPYNDSFEIASNDPDEATVTITVSGTGTVAPVADIAVTDSVGTVDDLQVPYGDVTVGTSSPAATVTLANQGTADLDVSGIALSGTDAADFSLDVNGGLAPCGSTTPTVTAGNNCTVTVTFSPATTGAKGASLDITSNDPDEASVNVTLGGNGLPSGANNPPSSPALAYPANGQVNVDLPVVFAWYRSTDPDGDAVTYDLFVCDNPSFTGCDVPKNPSPIASAVKTGGLFAAGVGFMVLGMVLGGSISRRKKAALLIAILAVAVMLLAACGGDDGKPPVPPVGDYSYPVGGLSSGTTYYWKVVADDVMGGTTPSATWSFTTR